MSESNTSTSGSIVGVLTAIASIWAVFNYSVVLSAAHSVDGAFSELAVLLAYVILVYGVLNILAIALLLFVLVAAIYAYIT
jgi:uncharacterized membrane protein